MFSEFIFPEIIVDVLSDYLDEYFFFANYSLYHSKSQLPSDFEIKIENLENNLEKDLVDRFISRAKMYKYTDIIKSFYYKGKLIRKEFIYNGVLEYITNYKSTNGLLELHGKQYYIHENKYYKIKNYKNGKLDGYCYTFKNNPNYESPESTLEIYLFENYELIEYKCYLGKILVRHKKWKS